MTFVRYTAQNSAGETQCIGFKIYQTPPTEADISELERGIVNNNPLTAKFAVVVEREAP